ncbi:MAG: ORF6N domain-containing protein, partial [Deltaproteobacteria bacterium]|nr:ORF6N domain-containing protein [Deltaproteobacteria bacterium]
MNQLIPSERIESHIHLVRGQKVILSTHLAELYEVQPKVLVQAVKRNIERFPADFLFQLTAEEFEILKSQFVTSSWGGLRRANPYAFSEQGVAMMSAVLRSQRAVQVSIEIMRTFVRLREVMAVHKDLAHKVDSLEKKYDFKFKIVFETLDQLMEPPPEIPEFTKVKGFQNN